MGNGYEAWQTSQGQTKMQRIKRYINSVYYYYYYYYIKDLGWKVLDGAQSFVLRSYTMHEVRNQHVSIG